MKAAVLTISDGCSRGEREDRSGPALIRMLETEGWTPAAAETVPDNVKAIREAVARLGSSGAVLIVTTGGTGLSPTDVTPEAVRPMLDKEIPGLGELMRLRGLDHTPFAALSRSLAGLYGHRIVLCLPGSEQGARQSLEAVLKLLPHALKIASGDSGH